jgi:hypothetical protein
MGIPFDKLLIPKPLQKSVAPSAPRSAKIAVAKGLIPTTADVQLALLYVLAVDKDRAVAKTARKTISSMPNGQILSGISQSTFGKVLEFVAQFKPDPELDERLIQLRNTPDRAAEMIASRAGPALCEAIVRNQERLLMTPTVFAHLHANEHCSEELLQNAEAFLRLHDSLPEVAGSRPFQAKEVEEKPAVKVEKKPKVNALDHLFNDDPAPEEASEEVPVDPVAPKSAVLEPAESEALPVSVKEAPADPGLDMFNLDTMKTDKEAFGVFSFDFDDGMDGFSWDLTQEEGGEDQAGVKEEEQVLSIEMQLRDMTVGRKIKLAYTGNMSARKILIRDSNKIVAAAVVKSGRLTPNEVASFAGNKNLNDEVVRLIAENKEFIRKYPVQVALVNNPKCPRPIALKIMKTLNKKDLQQLANNKGVPSAIFGVASKLFKAKYRK